jgi:hypothetical protein
MPSKLTKLQMRVLITEHLRPAFAAEGARARALGLPWDDSNAGFDTWRRSWLGFKVGKRGLRCCSQADYRDIIAHCWDARGRLDIAQSMLQEDPQANEMRQVLWKIRAEAKRANLPPEYAGAICERQYGCTIQEASLRQLWSLFYTMRNRVNKRLKTTSPT